MHAPSLSLTTLPAQPKRTQEPATDTSAGIITYTEERLNLQTDLLFLFLLSIIFFINSYYFFL